MTYYSLENEELIIKEFDDASAEIQSILLSARKDYVIEENVYDDADDTSDSGLGYDYNNSYRHFIEPAIETMAIKDGKLYGFVLSARPEVKILCTEGKQSVDNYSFANHSSSGRGWKLLMDDTHKLGSIVFIRTYEGKVELEAFPKEVVKSIAKRQDWEDYYGYPEGNCGLWLQLTDEAMEDRDAAVKSLAESLRCQIVIVKYLE